MLKNSTLPYYEWISVYKKEYGQLFESEDENWRKKHDYKNLKDFIHQVDKVKKKMKQKKKKKMKMKQIKNYHHG